MKCFLLLCLGVRPHTRYAGEGSTPEIGKACVIREHVTMHPGTAIDAMKTVVGDNGLFLAATHVAHDCVVGDNAIFANNAALGGHAKIGSNVMLGGFATVQQWCRVGDHAMIGSQTAVDSDVIPFGIAVGNRAKLTGINVIGLGRRGFSDDSISTLRALYRDLFRGGGVYKDRFEASSTVLFRKFRSTACVQVLNEASKNGICQAPRRQDG